MIEHALIRPCGHVVLNRLCKATMTEGLADAHDNAPAAHQRLNNLCQAEWYYRQIERLGAGQSPLPELSQWWAMLAHLGKDMATGMRRKLVAGA